MNINEVLATLASEALGREIRPNDEPNASQSSNDVFPSAIHLAATRELVDGPASPRSSTSPRRSARSSASSRPS